MGCKVAGVFMGAMGFCDDLILLAPTRDAMQVMLDTCQRFASRFNLKFSTDPDPEKSKTKSIFAWQVPRATHRYFVDQLLSCGHSSVRTDIMARYTRFIKGLQASPSMEVAVMFGVAKRDVRTVTGSATGNRARHPCSIPVDGLHKHPAFGQYREGAKIIQLVKSSYQTTIGGSRPP